MKPLSVVAFLDGRPGHEKQTKGVLRALAELTPINIEYRKTPLPSFGSLIKDWWNYFSPKFFSRQKSTSPVDLIIGAGSRTHIPMLLFKKKCAALPKTVTCMTPILPLLREFDLCLIPQHDGAAAADNIFITVGPPGTATYSSHHDPQKGLILVGGLDEKSHVWNTDMVLAQVRGITEKEPAMRWTISSSPRTPEETIKKLEAFAGTGENVIFFRAEETPSGWIEEQYGIHADVWVTADSISMVYEALTAGCRVGILPVAWKREKSKFQRSLQYVTGNRLVIPYEKWLTGEETMVQGKPLDEASRCAGEIMQKWWPDRLQ